MKRIYALVENNTGLVRYVGFTTKSLIARFNSHLKLAMNNNQRHVYCWLRKINFDARVTLLAVIKPDEDWRLEEQRWIKHYRSLGHDLTNTTDGGEGTLGHSPSLQANLKRSKSLLRWYENNGPRHHTEETRKKIGQAGVGRKHTIATKEKMSISRIGHVVSQETRLKIRHAKLGKPSKLKGTRKSPETIERMRQCKLGSKNPMFGLCGDNYPRKIKSKLNLQTAMSV